MKIPIRNLYYLLCYAWDKLKDAETVDVRPEDCPRVVDLLARVLANGVTHLLKKGLDRGYLERAEEIRGVKGKLDLGMTVKRTLLSRAATICWVDDLSHDVMHNRIIRSTMQRLVQVDDLDIELRKTTIGLLRRLDGISPIALSASAFRSVQLHRNNAVYGLLLDVCRLLLDSLAVDERTGAVKFRDFVRDERTMASLFERFVFNFYQQEQTEYRVKGDRFAWQDVVASPDDLARLPLMRTDVALDRADRRLVIEVKYYTEAYGRFYERDRIRSTHLYQLYAYLKNLTVREGPSKRIDGLLLYPAVRAPFDHAYAIQGHRLRAVTVNLDQEWRNVHAQMLAFLN